MTYARRLAFAHEIARSFQPDPSLREVYADGDVGILPVADDAFTPCPQDDAGHVEVNGRCILCGEKS